jgi:hypothetical protein
MRLPWTRSTVRRMLVAVAVVAIGLAVINMTRARSRRISHAEVMAQMAERAEGFEENSRESAYHHEDDTPYHGSMTAVADRHKSMATWFRREEAIFRRSASRPWEREPDNSPWPAEFVRPLPPYVPPRMFEP